MAEKTLNTKIQLRYDTWANWSLSNATTQANHTNGDLILKSGEAGICVVPAEAGQATTEPTVLMKVGDGSTAFKNLGWISALAADVYDWAKAATKPTYAASEITGLSDKIAAEETNTTYRINKVSNYQYKLQAKEKGSSTWTDVSETITIPEDNSNQTVKAGTVTFGADDVVDFVAGSNMTVTGDATAKTITITGNYQNATQSADGLMAKEDKTTLDNVDDAIAGAVEAGVATLDYADTAVAGKYVSAVSETNGVISVTRADLPTVPDITISESTATVPTSDTVDVWDGATASGHAITASQVTVPTKKYVDDLISALPESMVFKGTLGTGGTITSLPTASKSTSGHTYKVITAGTYDGQAAKVGDVFVCGKPASTYQWILIPAGDVDTDTWRQINVNGTQLLGNGISTGAVNYVSGTDVVVSGSGNNITISHTTSKTTHTAAAVKVGNDNEGHVVIGDALAATDIAMTGYTKAAAADIAITTSDTASSAIGKLEKTSEAVSDKISSAVTAALISLDSSKTAPSNHQIINTISLTDGKLDNNTTWQEVHVQQANIDQAAGDVLVFNCGSSTTNI